MLQLDRGRAMRHLTDALEELGYRWAYRVVDARAFGLPQRRLRVVLLASRTEDPREVLFADDVAPDLPELDDAELYDCGFYWTEGVRGLGWVVDAVPTLKGGSAVGIVSPPAVRRRAGYDEGLGIVTPARSSERSAWPQAGGSFFGESAGGGDDGVADSERVVPLCDLQKALDILTGRAYVSTCCDEGGF